MAKRAGLALQRRGDDGQDVPAARRVAQRLDLGSGQPMISVRNVDVARPTWPSATMVASRSGQLSRTHCGPAGSYSTMRPNDAPRAAAPSTDRVPDHVHRTALFAGQRRGDRGDVGVFACERVGVGVTAGATAAPVHRGHAMPLGEARPTRRASSPRCPCRRARAAAAAGPGGQQADAHIVGAGDPLPGSLHAVEPAASVRRCRVF